MKSFLCNLSGRATGSTEKDHNDFTLSTSITTSAQEESLKDEHAVKMILVDVPAIPIHELKHITRNFSSASLICKGFNGYIYRGALKIGQVAAIKKLHYHFRNKEFLEQVLSKHYMLLNTTTERGKLF